MLNKSGKKSNVWISGIDESQKFSSISKIKGYVLSNSVTKVKNFD